MILYIDDYKPSRDFKIEFRCPITKKHLSPEKALSFTPKTQILIEFSRSRFNLVLTNFSIFTEEDLGNWLKVKFRIFQPHKNNIYEQIDPKVEDSVTPCFFFDESYVGRIPTPKTIKRKQNKHNFEQNSHNLDNKFEDDCLFEKASKKVKRVHLSNSIPDICPICFSGKSNKTSMLMTCEHDYCYHCLREWLVGSDKCPECKQVSQSYVIKIAGQVIMEKKIKSKAGNVENSDIEQRTGNRGNIDENCCKCGDGKLDFLMLVCDECNQTCCHIYCLNPPLEHIPEEDWYCDDCLKKLKINPKKRR